MFEKTRIGNSSARSAQTPRHKKQKCIQELKCYKSLVTPEVCPNCGEDVPPKARACPHCGSDEETGWSEQAAADSLGLPDDNFDYQDFVKREFEGKSPKPRGLATFWWVVAIILLVVLTLVLLRH